MEDEDTTYLDLEPEPTPTHDVFDLMALQLSHKLKALKTAASHVHSLTPVAAHYLALALHEVIEVATDLHRYLTFMADSGPTTEPSPSLLRPNQGQARAQ